MAAASERDGHAGRYSVAISESGRFRGPRGPADARQALAFNLTAFRGIAVTSRRGRQSRVCGVACAHRDHGLDLSACVAWHGIAAAAAYTSCYSVSLLTHSCYMRRRLPSAPRSTASMSLRFSFSDARSAYVTRIDSSSTPGTSATCASRPRWATGDADVDGAAEEVDMVGREGKERRVGWGQFR